MGIGSAGALTRDRATYLKPVRLTAAIVAAVGVLGVLSASAAATPPPCDTYTGADNGLWATGTNWSDNAPPTSGEVACLGGMTVDVAATSPVPTADSVQNGSLVITTGDLTLTSTIDDSSIVNLSMDDVGALTAPAGQTVDVTGNFEWGLGGDSTMLAAAINQTGGGSFTIDGSGLGGPAMTSAGSIKTTSPVSITNENFGFFGGPQTLTTTSTITLSNSEQLTSLSSNSTITAAGITQQASDGYTYGFWGANLVLTGGTTTVAYNTDLEAGTLTLQGGELDDNSGIVAGSGYTLSTTIDGGTFTGDGNIAGNVTNVSGTVAPPYGGVGDQLTISGSYTQDAGGTLDIGMDGSDSSLLRVFDGMTLAGDVSVTNEDGFVPSSGEMFEVILSGPSRTGTVTLTGPDAGGYSASYGTQTVSLVAGSNVTQPVPAGGSPKITGTPAPGQQLTCDHGTWSNSPTGYTYQWKLDGAAISDTGSTYQVASSDAGHELTCTVIASNNTGPSAPATSPPVSVPAPSLGAVPVNVKVPVISGSPATGDTLTCGDGQWTNDPTKYTVQWNRDGSPIANATAARYTVQFIDQAMTLTCTVIASNTVGPGLPATSVGAFVGDKQELNCPKPTGRLSGTTIGPLALGEPLARAERALRLNSPGPYGFREFCLYAGFGIRAATPTAKLLGPLKRKARAALKGRLVIALTPNRFYAIDGVLPGGQIGAVPKRLHVGKPFVIGQNTWYFIPGKTATGVLKVRHGEIFEVGIANKQLTSGSRTSQRRFMSSFG
jgi:hypothetical protein